MNEKKAVTVTVVANMTSNYGESLGNISSIQKVFKNGRTYPIRTRESIKNAIMVQSCMYDDLQTVVNKVTQKKVGKDLNATNCRALEGGYMNTGNVPYKRSSSFHVTDAIGCSEFVADTRFHNNLYLAQNYADQNNLNLQVENDAKKCGLMPYQYEYDKDKKIYSLTIDLENIGIDKNYNTPESSQEEKAKRVILILDAVEKLSLLVKGNLDNSEPLFVVGGLIDRKTHYFENVVSVKANSLHITRELKDRIKNGCQAGLLGTGSFNNESEIKAELKPISIAEFFDNLRAKIKLYYEV